MKFNHVRIFAFFILLIGVGAFTSCSSLSQDTDEATNGAFVGSWKLTEAKFGSETAKPESFAGFVVALNSSNTYVITNPTSFPVPSKPVGTYEASGGSLIFDGSTSVRLVNTSGNSMTWEWEVSIPGKATTTYIYTFTRI
ncbi:hypothetical protein WAF17_15545 [Bernardetia sp. ABR2-2B]|uniref:hypothetical protein n=1 Tax=Bernardetia sp. ABR2-2B TaxID=3127472 RepID=UPI0030D52F46